MRTMVDLDVVARYAASQGLQIAYKTLLVEGTTDVNLLVRAAASRNGGAPLIGESFAVVAAGVGDRGGAAGVVRELIALRQISRAALGPNGMPLYRFAALFDNDIPGNTAVRTACGIDSSIIENRDVFKLYPVMPVAHMIEPGAIGRELVKQNQRYRGLKWEIEDSLDTQFVEYFLDEHPSALIRRDTIADKIHWELTDDGKARLHRFVHESATDADLAGPRQILLAIRSYLNVK